MPRLIGSSLPVPLSERPRGDDLAARPGVAAIIITTTNRGGWRHPAMASCGEVPAPDSQRVCLAIRRESGSADHHHHGGRLTPCFIEPGMAYYMKAALPDVRMPGFPGLARFEARVRQVVTDEAHSGSEPGAAIVDGVRYCVGRSAAAGRRDWSRAVGGLWGHV